jgi:hypothetical protein
MKMKHFATITISILILAIGILLLSSCKRGSNSSSGEGISLKIQTEKMDDSAIQEELLIGSWEDSSPAALHFSLFEDGTARSDNMQTLLYKKWKVNKNQIIFTIESIGNDTSSIENVPYEIEKLTKNKLILRNGEFLLHYTKKP